MLDTRQNYVNFVDKITQCTYNVDMSRVGKTRSSTSARSRRDPGLDFRLIAIMDERDLTYADVERMTGIPQSTLSDMGRGIIQVPGSEHLVKICRALRLSPGDLLKLVPENNSVNNV
jgi:DNA-binding Xre family transcriptional regulator